MSDRRKILSAFEEQQAFWEPRAAEGIERYRKGNGRITVVDKDGTPVPNAKIKLIQKSHEFRFGANIFMMIAALQMVQKIKEDDILLISLKNGGIIAAALAMSFIYVEEGANLARIRRELDARENYIYEELAKGEREMILPMLRPAFESKYSMAHFVDISPEEENWNNAIYENKYGISILEVLPWDEWEEAVGISSGE